METSSKHRVALVLNRDIMFGSRIRSALAGLDLEAQIVGSTESFAAAMDALGDSCAIAVIDMNGDVDWAVVQEVLARAGDPPPTLAFGPHVDVENRRAAKASGVSRIVSNGQFHQQMPQLIDRYRR